MKPEILITDDSRQAVANILNTLLADEFVLYTKTRRAHWNVQGPSFMELHKFFEGQYEALDEVVDSVAERIRSLGHFAVGSLTEYVKLTNLLETDQPFGTQKEILHALLNDHETIIRILRPLVPKISDEYHDYGTSDFITGLMESHEKTAWMIRSYLV